MEKNTNSKKSLISVLGELGMEVGTKLGKATTEFFTGKQPTTEEKELSLKRKERLKQLKEIQEEAQFRRDLELAQKGEYIPPIPKEKKNTQKKDDGLNIFNNLGKYNPLEDFNKSKSFGTQKPDFGLEGFSGAINPMKSERREQ